MRRDMNRRDVLRVGGAIGIASLSGCTALADAKRLLGDDYPLELADDPGVTSYPEQANGDEKSIIQSRDMHRYFYRQLLHPYREENDREGLYRDATGLTSVARVHSRDMHKHEYVGVNAPDGTPPSGSLYDGLQSHAESVTRIVHTYSTTVVNADGTRVDEVNSETVATAMWQEMTDDPEKNDVLLQPAPARNSPAMGIGFYVTGHEESDGSVVADVYLTVDFVTGFKHDMYNN